MYILCGDGKLSFGDGAGMRDCETFWHGRTFLIHTLTSNRHNTCIDKASPPSHLTTFSSSSFLCVGSNQYWGIYTIKLSVKSCLRESGMGGVWSIKWASGIDDAYSSSSSSIVVSSHISSSMKERIERTNERGDCCWAKKEEWAGRVGGWWQLDGRKKKKKKSLPSYDAMHYDAFAHNTHTLPPPTPGINSKDSHLRLPSITSASSPCLLPPRLFPFLLFRHKQTTLTPLSADKRIKSTLSFRLSVWTRSLPVGARASYPHFKSRRSCSSISSTDTLH